MSLTTQSESFAGGGDEVGDGWPLICTGVVWTSEVKTATSGGRSFALVVGEPFGQLRPFRSRRVDGAGAEGYRFCRVGDEASKGASSCFGAAKLSLPSALR